MVRMAANENVLISGVPRGGRNGRKRLSSVWGLSLRQSRREPGGTRPGRECGAGGFGMCGRVIGTAGTEHSREGPGDGDEGACQRGRGSLAARRQPVKMAGLQF